MRVRLFFFCIALFFVCMPTAAARSMTTAAIDPAQCVIGGIKPWECSMDYVEQVYGTKHTTDYKDGPYNGQWVTYDYNGGRFVVGGFVRKDGSTVVCSVRTTDAAMATPAGVHVGMRLYQVFQVYGPVKPSHFSDGEVAYVYSATLSDSLGFTLIIDQNKVVKEISVWSSE